MSSSPQQTQLRQDCWRKCGVENHTLESKIDRLVEMNINVLSQGCGLDMCQVHEVYHLIGLALFHEPKFLALNK